MAAYTEQDLRRALKQGEFASFYLLTGPEDYLRDEYERLITNRCIPGGEDLFNLHRFDMANVRMEQVADAMLSLPMLAERRLVVLRHFQPDSMSEFDQLYDLLTDLPSTTVVICNIPADGKRGKRLQKLCRLAEERGALLDFMPKSRGELHRMFRKKAAAAGVTMDTAACDALLASRGTALAELQPEMEKLIAAASETGAITAALVEKLVVPSVDASAFDIAQKLLSGQTGAALRILTSLLQTSYRRDPIMLFGAVSAAFLDLYRAKCGLNAGMPCEQLADALHYGGRKFALRRAYNQVDRYDTAELRQILSLLADADIRLKTGGVPLVVLQRLLVEIAAVVGKDKAVC